MLLRLHIEDLAIIDALTLDFDSGFSVLTGETGAGKSIVLGAMNLVLGERASADDVRSGCERAVVEALFHVDGLPAVQEKVAAAGAKEEGAGARPAQLVIRREIGREGRSRCLLNGRLVPLFRLKEIGDLLVDLHGQHQHQSLLKVETHQEILDAFGGGPAAAALADYRRLFERHGEVLSRMRGLCRDERERARRQDLLAYQLQEIDAAAPRPGEDQDLEAEAQRLAHAGALIEKTAEAQKDLIEGEGGEPAALDLLARCRAAIAQAAKMDPSIEELADRLGASFIELEDAARELRRYAAGLDHDPRRLESVEERLHVLRGLKSKYGETLEEVLAERDRIEAELQGLSGGAEEKARLEAERVKLEPELLAAAERLTRERRRAGKAFAKGLLSHLKDLHMEEARFEVRQTPLEVGADPGRPREAERDEGGEGEPPPPAVGRALSLPDGGRVRLGPLGADSVEFMIGPNPGEDLKPLRKIASGGELSRIMLALKLLMRELHQVPTLVFDEIDTGISGRTGERIGSRMAELGGTLQILCITHLPQIAAAASIHFHVAKTREKGRTVTRVSRLTGDERQREIARLLSGRTESEPALEHAGELLRGRPKPGGRGRK